jgi:hypothetical protein
LIEVQAGRLLFLVELLVNLEVLPGDRLPLVNPPVNLYGGVPPNGLGVIEDGLGGRRELLRLPLGAWGRVDLPRDFAGAWTARKTVTARRRASEKETPRPEARASNSWACPSGRAAE